MNLFKIVKESVTVKQTAAFLLFLKKRVLH